MIKTTKSQAELLDKTSKQRDWPSVLDRLLSVSAFGQTCDFGSSKHSHPVCRSSCRWVVEWLWSQWSVQILIHCQQMAFD